MRRKCRSLRMIEWSRHSPPHAADQAFHIRILPRAPWRRAPRECLSDLLCDPRHRWVRRDTEMHDLAALVVEHDEAEQEVERGRGDHEEIDRRQAIGVICKECPPRLRWSAMGNGPCISRRRPGRWKSQASKARHGSEVRPTVCSPATSVGPDRGSSLDTGGRPGFPRRDFHVQKSLNPLRCQPMTVSGLTITRGVAPARP